MQRACPSPAVQNAYVVGKQALGRPGCGTRDVLSITPAGISREALVGGAGLIAVSPYTQASRRRRRSIRSAEGNVDPLKMSRWVVSLTQSTLPAEITNG